MEKRMAQATLNGRVARHGWRSAINQGKVSKRREHRRVRQNETKEWQVEALDDVWFYIDELA
jgi:hypothetical protein